MIGMTNDGFGLLRALAPDIIAFLGVSFAIVAGTWTINRAIAEYSGDDVEPAGVPAAQRKTRYIALWIWVLLFVCVLFHAASVTWSLRAPRSDVDPSAVYRQMDGFTQGSPR